MGEDVPDIDPSDPCVLHSGREAIALAFAADFKNDHVIFQEAGRRIDVFDVLWSLP